MNKEQIIGNWQQFKGEAQRQWGKLTNDQLDVINGDRMKLTGKIQEAYGIAKEEAEEQVRNWEARCTTESKNQKDQDAA